MIDNLGSWQRYPIQWKFREEFNTTVGVGNLWKNKGGSGIGYQLNFNCGSRRVLVHVIQYQKTLASLAKRHNGVEYVLLQHQIFDGHRLPTFFIICRASNQSIWSLRLANTTADLIPYPFGSGIEEQIPVLPSRIQVPVPALYNGSYNS